MGWRQVFGPTNLDWAREAAEPFWVPDRTEELVGFGGAAFLVFAALVGLVLRPTTENLAYAAPLILFAAVMCVQGRQRRSYRLARMRTVADLRARLAESV